MGTSFNIDPRPGDAQRPRSVLFSTVLALLVSLSPQAETPAVATPQVEGPRLEIAEHEVNLGVVTRGTVLEHTFTLRNVGNETLKVLKAQSGCSCSVASFDEEIAPGETGNMHVVVDTATLGGAIAKGVSISTNDRYVSNVQVVVQAIVLGSVDVLPGYRAILSNRVPQTKEQSFLVRQHPSESGELRVHDAAASVPWIRVDTERIAERRDGAEGIPAARPGDWLVRIALTGPAPAGRTQQQVRFRTDLQREPEVTLNLTADILPPVELNTPGIRLVAGQPQVVLVSVRRDLISQPFTVETPQGLSARAEDSGRVKGRFFKIHLEWTGAAPEEPLELRVNAGDESRTFEVHVSLAE